MKDKMVIIQKGRKIRALLFHLGDRHMGAMERERDGEKKALRRGEVWEEERKERERKKSETTGESERKE